MNLRIYSLNLTHKIDWLDKIDWTVTVITLECKVIVFALELPLLGGVFRLPSSSPDSTSVKGSDCKQISL